MNTWKDVNWWLKLSSLFQLETRDLLANAKHNNMSSALWKRTDQQRKIFSIFWKCCQKVIAYVKLPQTPMEFCWCPYAALRLWKRKGLRTTVWLPDLYLKKHVWNPTHLKLYTLKNRNKKLFLLSFAVSVEEIGPFRTGLFTSHPEDWRYANN